MDLKQIAKNTASVLISYLTYEAVQMVLLQLQETDPPLAFWFSQFSGKSKIQNGEAYIQELLAANQPLAFRIMTVREHLADEIADFLPEMARTGIQKSNTQLRCQHLERIVSFQAPAEIPEHENIIPDLDSSSN